MPAEDEGTATIKAMMMRPFFQTLPKKGMCRLMEIRQKNQFVVTLPLLQPAEANNKAIIRSAP